MGMLFAAYQDYGAHGNMCTNHYDNYWHGDSPPVPFLGMSESPALALFNGLIYCARQAPQGYAGKGTLVINTFDGDYWSGDRQINPYTRIYGSPALAAFSDNLLVCAYQGANPDGTGDGLLHYVTYNKTTASWSADQKTSAVNTGSPALAMFRNKLYCVRQQSTRIGLIEFNGTSWINDQLITPQFVISGSPALAAFSDDLLVCAYKGFSPNNGIFPDMWLHYCTFDGTTWKADTKTSAGIYGSPALAKFDDKLYCVRQDQGQQGDMWSIEFDGTSWINDQRAAQAVMSESPALVVAPFHI